MNVVIFYSLHLNRYEEVEVRNTLEEKEKQEEKKRKEEITEKDSGRSSPKVSSANNDSKKVETYCYCICTLKHIYLSHTLDFNINFEIVEFTVLHLQLHYMSFS